MSLTKKQVLALIEARNTDPAFALLLDRRDDTAIAAVLSEGRIRYAPRLITERGIISALGPIEGEGLLSGLEAFADSTLAPEHPLALYHAGIKRVIGWLKAPAEGVDIGDPLTHQLLDTMVAVGVPGVTAGRVAAVKALAAVADPISVDEVSNAINARDKGMI